MFADSGALEDAEPGEGGLGESRQAHGEVGSGDGSVVGPVWLSRSVCLRIRRASPLTPCWAPHLHLELLRQQHSPTQHPWLHPYARAEISLWLWEQQEKQAWESSLPFFSAVVTRAAKRGWTQTWTCNGVGVP